jgi:hypothetical protein
MVLSYYFLSIAEIHFILNFSTCLINLRRKDMINDKRLIKIWVPTIVLMVLSLACGSTTTEKLQEAVNTQPAVNNQTPGVSSPSDKIEDNTAPLPTPTTIQKAEPLLIQKVGFGQDGISAGFAFLLENPSENLAISSSQYQIAAYDEEGVILKTDSGYIELLLPGQILGIAGDLYIDEGKTISEIKVQIKDGKPEITDITQTLTTENVEYFESDYFESVTGIISNPYSKHLSNVKTYAVIYDVSGNIIGGGLTYVNFLLANSSTGVRVSVTSNGDIGNIELYPTLSGLSSFSSIDDIPAEAANIEISDYGFGVDNFSVGFGFLVNNNFVLAVDDGYINVILPNQILGIGGDLYNSSSKYIDHIDVQIIDGKYISSEILPEFSYENITFSSGSYSSSVTGVINNPYTQDITNLKVSAITFDQNGNITGGGFTYLDFLPAEDKTAVDVSVTADKSTVSAEIYATISSLSVFD